MTKRLTTYLMAIGLAISLIFIFGCPGDNGVGAPPKVTGLTIMADTEGDGIILSWNAVDYEDLEGYDVITPGGDTILLEANETSYTDDAPSSTGDYDVYTVGPEESSGAVTISSAPTAGASVILYMYDPGSTTHSAFGWNPTSGQGQTYGATAANAGVIDFYVDTDFSFTAPANGNGSYTGDKTTYIYWSGTSDFFQAPEGPTGYANFEAIKIGYFAFFTEEGHYAKVRVTAEDGNTVTFNYDFQTIQSLRIF